MKFEQLGHLNNYFMYKLEVILYLFKFLSLNKCSNNKPTLTQWKIELL